MSFKYKLKEQEEGGEEESGLKQLKSKNELILTALGDLTADKLMDIINDPNNLKGTFVLRSEGLKELERKVFGDTKATNEVNQKIYQENGIKLYNEIAKEVGGFKKGTKPFSKKKTPNSKTNNPGDPYEFLFPEKNVYNLNLIKKYFDKTQSSKEKSIESALDLVKIDDVTLKLKPKDKSAETIKSQEKLIDTILTQNAKLVNGKDYSLTKQKSLDEDSYNAIREQLLKLLKENLSTAEKLIKQAEKEGHIKGDYSQMVLDTAKKIAKKWDELDPEEQKTMRDTYYQAFLKKIKK